MSARPDPFESIAAWWEGLGLTPPAPLPADGEALANEWDALSRVVIGLHRIYLRTPPGCFGLNMGFEQHLLARQNRYEAQTPDHASRLVPPSHECVWPLTLSSPEEGSLYFSEHTAGRAAAVPIMSALAADLDADPATALTPRAYALLATALAQGNPLPRRGVFTPADYLPALRPLLHPGLAACSARRRLEATCPPAALARSPRL